MKRRNLMTPKFDVLGLGTVAVDELIAAETYPPVDSKVRVTHAERQCGGLTAISLIAASRLGARCAYAGVLGSDELSKFAMDQMRREHVDLRWLKRGKHSPPVHSFIVIDAQRHTRNVFSHRAVEYRLPKNWPPKTLIESSRVLFVDHADVAGTIRAVRIAREAGIPIVADLERNSGPLFRELVGLIDHLILSRKFALKFTDAKTVDAALKFLWSGKRKLVAITGGKEGCWYLSESEPGKVRHQKAFPVEVVDTTGCGDVFHGAYLAALCRGFPAGDRIRFASAAAAIKSTRLGAQAGIPKLRAVQKFLNRS